MCAEKAEAIKGRPIIRWSQGLKDLVGVKEMTEEEILSESQDVADFLGLLSAEDWRSVIAHDARSDILELAESGGWPAVKLWLDHHRLHDSDERERMKTYKQFCERYQLDIDKKSSKSEYSEYVRNLLILSELQEPPSDKSSDKRLRPF